MLEKAKKPQMTRYNWNKLTEQKGFAWLNKEDCGIITSFPPPQKKKNKLQGSRTDFFSQCVECERLDCFVVNRMCAPVMVELEGETDPLQIAMKELK